MTIKYLGCDRVTSCRNKAKVCCSLDKLDIEGSHTNPAQSFCREEPASLAWSWITSTCAREF